MNCHYGKCNDTAQKCDCDSGIVDWRESWYSHAAIRNRIWKSEIMSRVEEKRDE